MTNFPACGKTCFGGSLQWEIELVAGMLTTDRGGCREVVWKGLSEYHFGGARVLESHGNFQVDCRVQKTVGTAVSIAM